MAFDERDKLHCTSKSDQLLVYSQNNSHSKVLTCPPTLINLAIACNFFFILYGPFEILMDQIGYTPHEGVGSYFQLFLLHRLSTSINCLQKHIGHIRQTKKIFENLAFFFSPETTKQVIQMTNSEDPDEMPHDVTFHQGLH